MARVDTAGRKVKSQTLRVPLCKHAATLFSDNLHLSLAAPVANHFENLSPKPLP